VHVAGWPGLGRDKTCMRAVPGGLVSATLHRQGWLAVGAK